MQNSTKTSSLFLTGRVVTLILVVMVTAGVMALSKTVTQAQQPAATPAPVILPNFLTGSNQSAGVVHYYSPVRVGCFGIVSHPTDKVWQVLPANGVFDLGNGTRPATLTIRQCGGYFNTADETRLISFWVQPPNSQDFLAVPYEPTVAINSNGSPQYAADAVYTIPAGSPPGTYKLFAGNNNRGWLDYQFEVRSGPVVRLHDAVTNDPKTSFRPGETARVNYWWFRPASRLEVGLYRLENQNPLVTTGQISVDLNGNYRGKLVISNTTQPGWFQLAVCNLNGGACNPVFSDPFYVGEDASTPYNSNGLFPVEIE